MSERRRIINIVIGVVLCAYLGYGLWSIPEVIGVDVSLKEMIAQNPSLKIKVLIWRIVSIIFVAALLTHIIRKNPKTKA